MMIDTPASLERVATATEARAAAEKEWRAAIIAASSSKSTRVIAAHAGVSHQRIQQIVAGK
jgi:hypothetical protein